MNILVTGGNGFIGSNLINFLEKKSPNSSLRIRSEQGNEALKLLDSNEKNNCWHS